MKANKKPVTAVAQQANDQSDTPLVSITSFDEEMISVFYNKITELEQDPTIGVIPILISSYGGDAHTLNAMRDIIKSCAKPVATIALGKAMSAGACLLAAGTPGYRFASKHTSIMVHEVSTGHGAPASKATDVQENASYVKSLNRTMLQNLSADMGASLKTVENLIKRKNNADWFITPQQAQKLGLIDHVMVPRLGVVPPSFGLGRPQPLKIKAKKKKP